MRYVQIWTGNTMTTSSADRRRHRSGRCPKCGSMRVAGRDPRTGAVYARLDVRAQRAWLVCLECVHSWRVRVPEPGLVVWAAP